MKREQGFLFTEDGVRLFYQIVGEGSETVIVPAASWLAADFEPLVQEYRCIFYDQRSRGQSDPVPDEARLGMQYEVRDLETVRQYFHLQTFSLIGWSYLGGMVTLYAAAHPGCVQKLVLICPMSPRSGSYDDPRDLEPETRLDPTGLKQLESMREAGLDISDPLLYSQRHWHVYLPLQMGNPSGLSNMQSTPWKFFNENPEKVSRVFPPLLDPLQERDWRRDAAQVTCPVLIIQGLEDLIPVAASREWATSFQEARLFTMAGSGHFPWIEDAETFFPVALQFLREGWPQGAVQIS